jgi:hypothetical protein
MDARTAIPDRVTSAPGNICSIKLIVLYKPPPSMELPSPGVPPPIAAYSTQRKHVRDEELLISHAYSEKREACRQLVIG